MRSPRTMTPMATAASASNPETDQMGASEATALDCERHPDRPHQEAGDHDAAREPTGEAKRRLS